MMYMCWFKQIRREVVEVLEVDPGVWVDFFCLGVKGDMGESL
jgi:hypothetical protein